MLSQVLGTQRARRCQLCFTIRNLLVFDGSETTIHFQLLGLGYTGTCHDSRGSNEGTTALVGTGTHRSSLDSLRARHILDGTLLALVDAIQTNYTTAIINGMIFRVDARCLAILGTKSATVTLGGIDNRLQIRETGKETQHGAHRTNGVAISTAILECQNEKSDQGYQGYH